MSVRSLEDLDEESLSDWNTSIDYVLVYKEYHLDNFVSTSASVECLPTDSSECHVRIVGKVSSLCGTPHPVPNMRSETLRQRHDARILYHQRLVEAGFQLKIVSSVEETVERKFVLVHAPRRLIENHAEMLNIKKKMVMRNSQWFINAYTRSILRVFFCNKLYSDLEEGTKGNGTEELSPSDRALIVKDILSKTSYGEEDDLKRIGIESMLDRRIYYCAYPLHEPLNSCQSNDESSWTQREWLSFNWASWKALFYEQPVDVVRSYLGPKIALYFAWFGVYTSALTFIAISGILLYLPIEKWAGVNDLIFQQRVIPEETCNRADAENVVMCPNCYQHCDFEKLANVCRQYLPMYTSHGIAPVLHSFLVCVWSAVFLQFWKRHENTLGQRWSLSEHLHQEEILRPEFVRYSAKRRVNPVTGREEPCHSRSHGAWVFTLHTITICIMILLIVGVNFGCHLLKYRFRAVLVHFLDRSLDRITTVGASMSAALVHSIAIVLLNWIFEVVYVWVVEWENPRTQKDFDDRYAAKVFLFQFLDYFVPLFYIIFVRTTVSLAYVWFPDSDQPWRQWILDTCTYTCLEELDQSMIVFFCGSQIGKEIWKFIWPMLLYFLRRFFLSPSRQMEGLPQWERDFYLPPPHSQQICFDYLRLVIQFSFIVLFSPSFPLAPVLALVVNSVALRNDAMKWVRTAQRVHPLMSSRIGVWMTVLETISTVAVPINGFILAFTTDIVPRYTFEWGLKAKSGNEYFDFAYSVYDARNITIEHSQYSDVAQCRFYGLYHPPCSLFNSESSCRDGYQKKDEYNALMLTRCMFMSLFMNLVYLVRWFLKRMISPVPNSVKVEKQKERYQAQIALSAQVNECPTETKSAL